MRFWCSSSASWDNLMGVWCIDGDEAAGGNWDIPKALLWTWTSQHHSQHQWEGGRRVWEVFIFLMFISWYAASIIIIVHIPVILIVTGIITVPLQYTEMGALVIGHKYMEYITLQDELNQRNQELTFVDIHSICSFFSSNQVMSVLMAEGWGMLTPTHSRRGK